MSFNPHEILQRIRNQQGTGSQQQPSQQNGNSFGGQSMNSQSTGQNLNQFNHSGGGFNNGTATQSGQYQFNTSYDMHSQQYSQQPPQQFWQQQGNPNQSLPQSQFLNYQLQSSNQNGGNQTTSAVTGTGSSNFGTRNDFTGIPPNNVNNGQSNQYIVTANPKNMGTQMQQQQRNSTASIDSGKMRLPIQKQNEDQIPQQSFHQQSLQQQPTATANSDVVDFLLNKVQEQQMRQVEFQEKQQVSPPSMKVLKNVTKATQVTSPSRKIKTEPIYDEVAEIIMKQSVEKILQKKERSFVPFTSKDSKRFNQPKVAGKLHLEQLQKILHDYPSLSKPCISIRITESDLS